MENILETIWKVYLTSKRSRICFWSAYSSNSAAEKLYWLRNICHPLYNFIWWKGWTFAIQCYFNASPLNSLLAVRSISQDQFILSIKDQRSKQVYRCRYSFVSWCVFFFRKACVNDDIKNQVMDILSQTEAAVENTLHTKRSFPLRISSLNVTRSAVGKLHFLCSDGIIRSA